MNTMSSTEFRKRFASLTQSTAVTVNGHMIGEWTPVPTTTQFREDAFLSTRDQTGLPDHTLDDAAAAMVNTPPLVRSPYHQRDPIRDPMREFNPAPKSGKKGK